LISTTPCWNDTLITTPVNHALGDLPHQIFGAVAGEFCNLINFSIPVRLKKKIIFLYFFIFLPSNALIEDMTQNHYQ